jgi:hypothetical protein
MAAADAAERAVGPLGTWERALVVVAVTHHGDGAPALLARLAAPAGPRCRAAAEALLALPAAARAPALAHQAARLFAPVPPGLARLDASWLEAALGALPPAAQAQLRAVLPAAGAAPAAGAGAVPPGVLSWLARVALGPCCALPPAVAAATALAASTPAAALLGALDAAGRERVALALKAAPRSARAAFCARLAPDDAAALLRAIEAAPDDAAAARRAQLDLTAVAARAPAEVGGRDLIRLMGALAVGAAVAGDGDVPQQLAQLLPRDLGQLLLAAAGPGGSLPLPGEPVH